MIKRAAKIASLIIAFLAVTGASAYLALTFIIQSEKTVIVPMLTGKEVVYALELLTSLDLDIKVKGSEYSSTVPKHYVIFQQPAAGAEIKKGRDVKIIFSKGPETVNLPNLLGLPHRQAQFLLEGEGVCVGAISRSHHPLESADHVIGQYPYAGAAIARTRCVNLLISNGRRPENYVMPRMAGTVLDKAVLLLESGRLRVESVSARLDSDRQSDIVLEQQPKAGSIINRTTPIYLVVNQSPLKIGLLSNSTQGRMVLFRHRTRSGYLRKHVRIEIGTGGQLDELFNDFVKPHTDIWLAIPAGKRDSVFVYENGRVVERGISTVW